MQQWWNVELVECHLSLCNDCINHCMKGGLVLNCFHSIWWCGWKWCVDGWNVTQTERRALKEHINILDCVQREWSEAEQCVRKCTHIVYVCGGKEMHLWEGWVCACARSCMCANADGPVPVTLVSLIFSRWETVSECNTHTAHPHTHRHTLRKSMDHWVNPLLERLKLRKQHFQLLSLPAFKTSHPNIAGENKHNFKLQSVFTV